VDQTASEVLASQQSQRTAVHTITTPFILNVSVNCYLVRSGEDFVLMDTGRTSKRDFIESELVKAGCKPGNLNLIALTHGDFDHCGNAAYFRARFASKIALHHADSGMVERGDMFWNRRQPNVLVKALVGLLFSLGEANRFKPDFYMKEGDELSQYGFDAQVIELPGHSKGSVGFMTGAGDLFCGDLLANTGKPAVWTVVDDRAAMQASVEKLNPFDIHTVYPGHGKPFPMQSLHQ
jgi:hydroxyacylglutathione hydrolase